MLLRVRHLVVMHMDPKKDLITVEISTIMAVEDLVVNHLNVVVEEATVEMRIEDIAEETTDQEEEEEEIAAVGEALVMEEETVEEADLAVTAVVEVDMEETVMVIAEVEAIVVDIVIVAGTASAAEDTMIVEVIDLIEVVAEMVCTTVISQFN